MLTWPLLAAVLLLAAMSAHAQTETEADVEAAVEVETSGNAQMEDELAAMSAAMPAPPKVPVAVMRFYGDEESVNAAFREATSEDVGNLPAFSPDIIQLTGPYGAYMLADEPPPPELSGGRHYALTGALYPDDYGKKHFQAWLWDVTIPSLVYTDEMVCDQLADGREFVTLMVEWIFSHITPAQIDAALVELAVQAEVAEARGLTMIRENSGYPVEPAAEPPESDDWRQKWLYIRASFDYSLIAYQVDTSQDYFVTDEDGIKGPPWEAKYAQASRAPFGFTLGVEFQFLPWMSAEAYGKMLFGEIAKNGFAPAVGLEVKFPLKPAIPFMIAPYIMAEVPLNSGGGIKTFSPIGLGGGLQFGVKGGNFGAFFLDAQFIYNLGDIYIVEPGEPYRDAHWRRWVLGFGIGYKIGFLNRKKADNR